MREILAAVDRDILVLPMQALANYFWILAVRLGRLRGVQVAGILLIVGVVFSIFLNHASAAVVTWDGGGADGTCGGGAGDGNKWSCGLNWSTDSVPGVNDIATFDSTSTKNATIDSAISVAGIDINTGYSGIITQASGVTVTIGWSSFDISAGTFTGGDSAINVSGAFTVSGGTFTSTSGTMTLPGAFTVSSGTFNDGGGTLVATSFGSTWDVATTETFNNLTINKSNYYSLVIGDSDTLVVTGTLTLTDGAVSTGTLDIRGNISQAATFDGGNAIIDFGDNGVAQTYTLNGGWAPTIRLDAAADASDSILFATASSISLLTITAGFAGTIPISNAGDYVVTFDNWNQAAGTYDASAQTSWFFRAMTISGGTFTPPITTTAFGTAGTWDINGTETFNNLTINENAGGYALTIAGGDTLIVTGTLTLTEGVVNTGTIDARGDIYQASTFDGGYAIIDFGDDGVAQTYTLNGGWGPTVRLNSAADANDSLTYTAPSALTLLSVTAGFSGTIPISNGSDYALTFDTWTQVAGSYDASAQSAWTLNDLNITGGSLVVPDLVVSNSANATWDVDTSQTFNNLTINTPYTLSITGGDTLVTTGTLTLTNGTLNSGTIDTRGDIYQDTTFDGGSTVIEFGDDGVAQTYTLHGGSAPTIELDSAADANDSLVVTAAAAVSLLNITAGFSGAIPLSNAGDYELTFWTWTQAAGSYSAAGQSSWRIYDFNHTAGSFVAPTTVTYIGDNQFWDFPTSDTFNNFLLANTSGQALQLNADDTLYVTGTLTLRNGSVNTGVLSPQGNVVVEATFDSGNAILDFTGSATQSFDLTGATGLYDGDIKVNKTGGQVNLSSTLVMNAINQDLLIQEGKFSLGGQALTVNGTDGLFTVEDGGNFQLQGAETLTLNASQPTLSSGSTVTYTGDGDAAPDTYTVTTLKTVYHHLIINSTDGATDTFQLGVALDVNGNLTNTAGTLDVVSGQNRAITLAGNWTNTGTFSAQAGTVTLDANTDHTVSGATTWYDLTLLESSNDADNTTVTFASATTQTIGHALTLDGLDSDDKLLIVASTPTSAATFDFTGASTFTGNFLTVTDNIALDNSSAVSLPLNPANSIEGSNTTGWFTPPGVTVSAISGNTTEAGGTATFTVVLDTLPTADVEIDSVTDDVTEGNVTIGATLTFTTLNWSTPQTVTVTGADDALDDGNIIYSIVITTDDTNTLDNAYDTVDPADVSVTNTDNDTAGVTVSVISGDTTEVGGTATFSVVLDSQPTADVEIDSVTDDITEGNVSIGGTLTFTTLNWATPQTVTVAGANDFSDDGDVVYSIVVTTDDTNTLDNAYDAINPADVSVTNIDNDTVGVTVSAISGNTTEAGGTATFTVVLDTLPTADVEIDSVTDDVTEGNVTSGGTLTFTTLNWNAPQTVTVTGANDALDDGDVSYSIVVTTDDTNTLDNAYDAVDPADVSVTNTDNETAGITVSLISGNTTEAGGTATFTVVLNAQPTADVEIDSVTNDATEGNVTTGATLTFTTLNWSTPQTVTVTGANDDFDDGNVSYSTVVDTDDTNTLDNAYDAIDPADVSVTNTDNDAVGITLAETVGNTEVNEAGATSDDFTLVLTSEPLNTVTIDLSLSSGITSPTATLTFTTLNWATPQTVTVTAVDDDLDETNPHVDTVGFVVTSVDAAYDDFVISTLSVDVLDNDSSVITVSAISGDTTEAGGTATFTVVLETEPTGDVTIDVATNDATEGAVTSAATLTFTSGNYSTPQTVTVTGANDAIDDGTVLYTIVVNNVVSTDALYTALNPADVSVSNTDDDTAGMTLTESGGTTDIDEQGPTSDTYTIVLASEPTGDVVVTLTFDSDQVSLSASTLTFTALNWSTPQTVTVTAVNDSDDETSPHDTTISHVVTSVDSVYDGFVVADVTVSILDNDSSGTTGSVGAGVTVSGISISATAGAFDCGELPSAEITISAIGANRAVLSNDIEFISAQTFEFTPEIMSLPWTLSSTAETTTVYVMLISTGNNHTQIFPIPVAVPTCTPGGSSDSTGGQTDSENDGSSGSGEPGVGSGGTEIVNPLHDGDVFKGETLPDVYWLQDGLRRPFLDEITFFTWFTSFDDVLIVEDAVLPLYAVGAPVLPRPGRILVKINSRPEVYFSEGPNILHHILSEGDAEMFFGKNWNRFIQIVPPTIFAQYVFSAPIASLGVWDVRSLFTYYGLHKHDTDRDGLTDEEEAIYRTNPESNDTDADGRLDFEEVSAGRDPLHE